MKSLPILNGLIDVYYMNKADYVIYYFQQAFTAGLLNEGECLPTENVMACNLNVPVLDIARAMFQLRLYGLIIKDEKGTCLSTLSVKVKEHIFSMLLRGKPCVLKVTQQKLSETTFRTVSSRKNYPLMNRAETAAATNFFYLNRQP